MNVKTYLRPSGRKRRELWSIIFGLSENFALEIKAFNFGIVYSIASSFFSSFLSTFLPFLNKAFYFYFLLNFLSFFVWSHSSSVLAFLIKYFDPLNYLVSVALIKNIRLFSLPKNILSSDEISISAVFFSFSTSLVFFFF